MLLFLRKGKISKWFSGIGQEAVSVGVVSALKDDDVILPMHRNLGVFTTRKVNLEKLFSQLMNKKDGFTKSRDRTFHFGCPEKNIIGMISHVGAMLPVANGFGYAFQLKKEKRIAVVFAGDGATSEGDFHEALNLAAVWKLPVIFVIENNGYALSTPLSEQYACKNLVDKAIIEFSKVVHMFPSAPRNLSYEHVELLAQAHHNLAVAYAKKEWYSDAEKEARIAFEMVPTNDNRKVLDLIIEKK